MSCKHGNWSNCEQCAEEEALWDRAYQAGFKDGKAQAAPSVPEISPEELLSATLYGVECWLPSSVAERVAEACELIAAAPDLMAACQRAFEQTDPVARPADWQMLRDALTKAGMPPNAALSGCRPSSLKENTDGR